MNNSLKIIVDSSLLKKSWIEIENAGAIDLISQFNLAVVVNELHKSGIAKYLYNGFFSREKATEFDVEIVDQLMRYLHTNKIVKIGNGGWNTIPDKAGLFSDIAGAQFGFYLEAYGNVVQNISGILKGTLEYGVDLQRDGKALGEHCGTIFSRYHTPIILDIIKEFNAKILLDLGCGNGQSLMDISKCDQNIKGIGIDLSAPAIQLANNIKSSDIIYKNLEFIVGNAFDTSSWNQQARSAEAVIATGVFHEHFRDGEDAVVALLNSFEPLFSENLKVLIIGEPEIRYDLAQNDQDLHLVHIFTKQGFPRVRKDWYRVIEKSNLSLSKVFHRKCVGPRFNFFVLSKSGEK